MLNPISLHLRTLWGVMAGDYLNAFRDLSQHGKYHIDALFGQFGKSIRSVLQWQDILAANRLRRRIGDEIQISEGALAEINKLRDKAAEELRQRKVPDDAWRHHAFHLEERITRQTPWLEEHREKINPFIGQRAAMIAEVEKEFAETRADILAKKSEVPIYRLEMIKRAAMSEIAETSQQVQLADPEIGDHFPYAEYITRDDRRVRPTHAAMNRFVALRTWEGWKTVVPPCGWNCRCLTKFYTRRQAIEKGWMTEEGKPKWELKWPNSAARINYENGLFPEWKSPRYWAAA